MSRHDEIRSGVRSFHEKNPNVWKLFVRFTKVLISKGIHHYSSKAIFERIRWETDVNSNQEDYFKLNNNYTSFYARAFMRKFPEHKGFFRTREQVSKYTPEL